MLHTAAAQVSIDWQAVHLFERPFQRSKRDMIPLRQFRLGYAAIEMFHQILVHLLHTLGLFFVQIGRSCRHGFRFIHFLAAAHFLPPPFRQRAHQNVPCNPGQEALQSMPGPHCAVHLH